MLSGAKPARTIIAYGLASLTTYILAAGLNTHQVIVKQAAIGMEYTLDQQIDTYAHNYVGLWIYGLVIAIALAIGFVVAFGLKRVLTPLAPIAYPAAGAASMLIMVLLVEQMLGGGAGVIGGARDGVGIFLQCLAGLFGGALFATLRPR